MSRKLDPLPERLYGDSLKVVLAALKTPIVRTLARKAIRESLGINKLGALASRSTELPLNQMPMGAREPRALSTSSVPKVTGWPRQTSEYVAAYRSGAITPTDVVRKALHEMEQLKACTPRMNILASCNPEKALREAAESTQRYREGRVRPLDGVPLLVKDQHTVAGSSTAFGSAVIPPTDTDDSTVVARLRAAGMIVIGKTVMTEWGLSPLGLNTHYDMPRNAHRNERVAGGSSTGSAVGVALGIAPIATGADAGGSVRIPASFNGIFGIKPTFGRVSRSGDTFGGTFNHVGCFGASTADVACFLDFVATSPDPRDPLTDTVPRAHSKRFAEALKGDVQGLVIGIEDDAWQSTASPIADACWVAVQALERAGARVVKVNMSLAKHAAAVGVLTVGCEGLALVPLLPQEHIDGCAMDVKVALAAVEGSSASDYLIAQRLRLELRLQLAREFHHVDVILSPMVPITAPRFFERDATENYSDPLTLQTVTSHAFLANLTGLPAMSVPVGVDPCGVPVGLQVIGDAWDETTVLAVSATLERLGVAIAKRAFNGKDLLA